MHLLRPASPAPAGAPRLSVPPSSPRALRPRSASLRTIGSASGTFDEEGRCMLCPLKQSVSFSDPNNNSAPDRPPIEQNGTIDNNNSTAIVYRSYLQRWVVLSAVCLLALSNATQWIAFAPLHDAANTFYCIPAELEEEANLTTTTTTTNSSFSSADCDVEMWSSQIFQLVGVLTGLLGMYVTDHFGIRVSCHFGAVLNLAGAILRVVSSLPELNPRHRLPVLYFGQTIAAMAQPFFLCLSPKVAEHWFGENQRALANSLSFIANPFGVVLGSLVPVLFVSSKQSSEIFYLNASLLGLASAVMALTLCVTRAHPLTPPSASSHCEHKPGFARGLAELARSRPFYIQTLTFGMAFALQWSIFVTADKYFSQLDYPEKLAGLLLSLSALSGTFASVLGGLLVDRTKRFNEFIKAAYLGIALTAAGLNLFLRHRRESVLDTVVLSVLLTLLGAFAVPVFPISLELGVESTFPVAEATSSGILIIAGQLQLFLLTLGMQFVEQQQWIYTGATAGRANYQLSVDLWTVCAVFAALFSCAFLWPKYHRLEYEQNAIFLHLLPPTFGDISGGNSATTNGMLLFPFAAATKCDKDGNNKTEEKNKNNL